MEYTSKNKGRNRLFLLLQKSSISKSIFHAITLLSITPAFLFCNKIDYNNEPNIKEELRKECNNHAITSNLHFSAKMPSTSSIKDKGINSIDIFIYNDDQLKRLDSYQRFDINDLLSKEGNNANENNEEIFNLEVGSSAGPKIILAVANAPESIYNEQNTHCYDTMLKLRYDIISENPQYPIMTCEIKGNLGTTKNLKLNLTPLLASITLGKLNCKLKEARFKDKKITFNQVYLINVNRNGEIFKYEQFTPDRFINDSQLEENSLKGMLFPQMLYSKIEDNNMLPENITFYAYPNDIGKETPGKSFTRLVIEGEFEGNIYYYPININAEAGGIKRGGQYKLNVTIKNLGATDPNDAVEPETLETSFIVDKWKEEDQKIVEFCFPCHRFDFSTNEPTQEEEGKVSNKENDNNITDLNIFIFNSYGILEHRLYKNDISSCQIELLKHCKYDIYACANLGYELKNINSLEQLKKYKFHLAYPDEFKAGIPMTGFITDFSVMENNLDKTDENYEKEVEKVIIEMTRMTARVVIDVDRSTLDKDIKLKIEEVRIGNCPKSAFLFAESCVNAKNDVFRVGYNKNLAEANILNYEYENGISKSINLYMLENIIKGDGKTNLPTNFYESYLEIFVAYFSDKHYTKPGEHIFYRFRLEDKNGKYEIKRNHSYHYTFKPSGNGLKLSGSWSLDASKLQSVEKANQDT